MPAYIKKYGLQMAMEISKFEMSHIQVMKEIIERAEIDCDFTLTRSMDVFLEEEPALKCQRVNELMANSGVTSLRDVQFTPAKDAEGVRVHAVFIIHPNIEC